MKYINCNVLPVPKKKLLLFLESKVKWQVSKKMTKEQIEAIFAKFDNNGDGKMSKEEFKQLMESKKS